MEAAPVIEGFDEVEDCLASLGTGFEATPIDQFLFKRAPKGFHGGIVVAMASPAHTGNDLIIEQ